MVQSAGTTIGSPAKACDFHHEPPSVSTLLSRLTLTELGLAIGFGLPFAAGIVWRLSEIIGWSWNAGTSGARLIIELLIVGALLVLILGFERLAVSSVGISKPQLADWKVGVASAGMLIGLTVLTAGLYAYLEPADRTLPKLIARLAPADAAGIHDASWWVALAVLIASACAEELAARGYAIERLSPVAGNVWAAAASGVILGLLARLPFWGFSYLLLIAPAECALTALYVRYRKLIPCAIAHVALNLFIVSVLLLGTNPVAGSSSRSASLRFGAGRVSRREAAVTELNRLLRSNLGKALPYVERAQSCYAKGDYSGTIKAISRAIKIEPKNANLLSFRASVYWAQGEYDKAIADYTQIIKLNPESGVGYRLRGEAYNSTGHLQHALADFAMAIKRQPREAENYFERSGVYQKQNQIRLALKDINRAIKLDPNRARFIADRALLYESMGDYDRAIADCNRLIKLNPAGPGGYGCRSHQYMMKGELGKAIADLGKWERADPGNWQVVYSRAKLEVQANHWNKARAELLKLAQFPDVAADDADWAALILSSGPNNEVRDGKAAIALATRACQQTGWKNADYVATLAAAYAEAGDFDSAIKWQRRAIQIAEVSEPYVVDDFKYALSLFEHRQPFRINNVPPVWRKWPNRGPLMTLLQIAVVMLMLVGLVTVCIIFFRLMRGPRRTSPTPS